MAVRINNSEGRRQFDGCLMVVKYNTLHAQPRGLIYRLVARRPAINRYQQIGTRRMQRANSLAVRAIAFNQAIGNMDKALDANLIKKAR